MSTDAAQELDVVHADGRVLLVAGEEALVELAIGSAALGTAVRRVPLRHFPADGRGVHANDPFTWTMLWQPRLSGGWESRLQLGVWDDRQELRWRRAAEDAAEAAEFRAAHGPQWPSTYLGIVGVDEATVETARHEPPQVELALREAHQRWWAFLNEVERCRHVAALTQIPTDVLIERAKASVALDVREETAHRYVYLNLRFDHSPLRRKSATNVRVSESNFRLVDRPLVHKQAAFELSIVWDPRTFDPLIGPSPAVVLAAAVEPGRRFEQDATAQMMLVSHPFATPDQRAAHPAAVAAYARVDQWRAAGGLKSGGWHRTATAQSASDARLK